MGEKIEERTVVQKVLRSLPDRFDSKISSIQEMKELYILKMDEIHGILTDHEMRKGIPSSKDAEFKASKSKKEKGWNTNSDVSDVESELVKFLWRLKKGSKVKGKNPLIFFNRGRIGHYTQSFLISMKLTMRKEGYTKIKYLLRRISFLRKMNLMRMNMWL